MNVGGLRPGRLSEPELDVLLAEAAESELTYDWLGETVDGGRRRHLRHSDFVGACERLRSWTAHARIGARVHPRRPPIEVRTTLLVVLRAGPFEIVAPNRIVAVVDEPERFGFAYGTLVGHPERGEESFVVERDRVTVAVRSAPGTIAARVAAPAVRVFQARAIDTYLAAITGT